MQRFLTLKIFFFEKSGRPFWRIDIYLQNGVPSFPLPMILYVIVSDRNYGCDHDSKFRRTLYNDVLGHCSP